jgi:hypothetical protein
VQGSLPWGTVHLAFCERAEVVSESPPPPVPSSFTQGEDRKGGGTHTWKPGFLSLPPALR